MNPQNMSPPFGPLGAHDYVNCPICGRSIEMAEITAQMQAVYSQNPGLQSQLQNTLQPIQPCKVCQSRMQQSAQGFQQ